MGAFDEVEVRNALGDWSRGFEVAGTEESPSGDEMYWLRRQADGSVLPAPVRGDRVRPASSGPPRRDG